MRCLQTQTNGNFTRFSVNKKMDTSQVAKTISLQWSLTKTDDHLIVGDNHGEIVIFQDGESKPINQLHSHKDAKIQDKYTVNFLDMCLEWSSKFMKRSMITIETLKSQTLRFR